ncbi:MAG: methyltransferase domain-containing protein [Caulobacter sp.]|nr:methyltransferase domain-containing protein [Caulobacter sp.]
METALTPRRQPRDFTPALPLLGIYDFTIATLTRERVWRSALLRQLNPQPGETIADLGCGTASFLALVGRQAGGARLVGVDPDARILERARRKLAAAGVAARLDEGYLRDASRLLVGTGTTKIVSSLVFHQTPMTEKRAGLAAILAALPPGGELHVADYGLQRSRLMRTLFRLVQLADGHENTQPAADGVLPDLMREAGFEAVEERAVIPTLTGSISLYRAVRPS